MARGFGSLIFCDKDLVFLLEAARLFSDFFNSIEEIFFSTFVSPRGAFRLVERLAFLGDLDLLRVAGVRPFTLGRFALRLKELLDRD